jgi:hypothetical protein
MMVVWGNQRFSAIRAYTVTVVREIVNSIDMNRVSLFISQPSTHDAHEVFL